MNTVSVKKMIMAGILALGVTAAGVLSPLSHPGTTQAGPKGGHVVAFVRADYPIVIVIHVPPRPKPKPTPQPAPPPIK